MLWPKKNSYKEFDNELNSCASKIPLPPPITFLMVGPLIPFFLQTAFILPPKLPELSNEWEEVVIVYCRSLKRPGAIWARVKLSLGKPQKVMKKYT